MKSLGIFGTNVLHVRSYESSEKKLAILSPFVALPAYDETSTESALLLESIDAMSYAMLSRSRC